MRSRPPPTTATVRPPASRGRLVRDAVDTPSQPAEYRSPGGCQIPCQSSGHLASVGRRPPGSDDRYAAFVFRRKMASDVDNTWRVEDFAQAMRVFVRSQVNRSDIGFVEFFKLPIRVYAGPVRLNFGGRSCIQACCGKFGGTRFPSIFEASEE